MVAEADLVVDEVAGLVLVGVEVVAVLGREVPAQAAADEEPVRCAARSGRPWPRVKLWSIDSEGATLPSIPTIGDVERHRVVERQLAVQLGRDAQRRCATGKPAPTPQRNALDWFEPSGLPRNAKPP